MLDLVLRSVLAPGVLATRWMFPATAPALDEHRPAPCGRNGPGRDEAGRPASDNDRVVHDGHASRTGKRV